MIVLPDTPPTALSLSRTSASSHLLSLRAAIVQKNDDSNDTTSYLINLEEYLQALTKAVHDKTLTYESTLYEEIPWSNIKHSKKHKLEKIRSSSHEAEKITWTVRHEIYMVVLAITLTYLKKAAEVTNSLIDIETENVDEYNENWKRIMVYYKTAISFILYGIELSKSEPSDVSLKINPMLMSTIHKISQISIQIVILIKFSWINRNSFQYKDETIQTENNSTLSKVAIYILQESKIIKTLIGNLSTKDSQYFTLDHTNWISYLDVVEKYIDGYAGLFLSLHMYKEDKLGDAIGLVHFSLLSLQSKKAVTEVNQTSKNPLRHVKAKFSTKKNEAILSNLNSVSSLKIDKSAFSDKPTSSSKLILNDLNYLFDQLIKLNLKFTKENDNLKFDKVASWTDIFVDNKWPTGSPIPISKIDPYNPSASTVASGEKSEYAGRGAYY
ncbi:hypothetical protein SBY92_002158 [Candida maltosa Xu316]|uniref:Uncharacterized protein n=1 Tax=Candida maltosa (strain Xu316) TaxID=1245528 RepID=M3JXC0_CANMX|nr:hypothetical protein G210_2660 [Candida maltosa Xu316]